MRVVIVPAVLTFLVLTACSTTDDAQGTVACAADPDRVQPGEKLCDGLACATGDQCVSGACTGGTCAPSANKTCGVGKPKACADGAACQQDLDCATDVCEARVCKPRPTNVHTDGRRNGGETGVDCGGSALPDKPCAGGERCKESNDCQSTCGNGRCAVPGATDGKKNRGESDIDCGGPEAPACKRGKTCTANTDCQLQACTSGVCAQPTATDALRNGRETDVDCGGAEVTEDEITYKAPPCREGLGCIADADCTTGACSPGTKTCSLPSCATAELAGILSCGAKETGEAGAAHESCCRSLTLPTRTTRRLDKYEITSGRYRAFLTGVGPNVRAWVAKYVTNRPTSQLAGLVALNPAIGDIFPQAEKDDYRSLAAHLSIDLDNYDGVRGCYNGDGSFGANTYWQDDATVASYGMPPRQLARTVSDEKPLNCQMPMMFAAFCAWDGGELATFADIADVWDANPGQPVQPKPNELQRPTYNWCNGPFKNGGFECQCDQVNNPGAGCNFVDIGEAGIFYEFPRGTNRARDNEPLIAAPGRFIGDASAPNAAGERWMDIYGNLAEYVGEFTPSAGNTFCDVSSSNEPGRPGCTRNVPGTPPTTSIVGSLFTAIPSSRLIGYSWEGHPYPRNNAERLPVTFQYGKFGGRCARPVE